MMSDAKEQIKTSRWWTPSQRWAALVKQREEQVFLLLTLLIGALVGLTVVAFIVLTERFGARIDATVAAAWRRLVVPIVGSLSMGFLLYKYFPAARGSGVPQTKAALFARGGRISLRTVFGKFFCTSATLASGIPLGREGPSVQVGAGIASVLGSAASLAVLRVLLGNDPLFKVPQYQLVSPVEVFIYGVLGLLGGLLSLAFTKSLLKLRERFLRLPRKTTWFQPAAGGIVVGLMGWFVPQTLGVGYSHVGQVLNGGMALKLMVLLLVLKLIGVVVSYASGNAGGIFGPALFLGAMLGGAVGSVAHNLFPGHVATAGAYALVGMGTTFAGIVRAPMTSVVMIFETTRDYSVIVPLMISNLVSFFVSSRFQRQPIYEVLAYQDGIHLPSAESRVSSGQRRVFQAMRPATEILTANMTVQEALVRARASARQALPVSNERGIAGIIRLAALEKAVGDGDSHKKLIDLIEGEEFPHLHADQSLTVALERMGAEGLDALPVVSRADVRKLEGIVALQDVMKLYGFAVPNTSG